jgi:hypothetical protein
MSDDVNPPQGPETEGEPMPGSVAETDTLNVIPFASGNTRAQWATALITVIMLLSVLDAVRCLHEIHLITLARSGADVEAPANFNWILGLLLGTGEFLAFLGSAIAFLMWHHRVYRNLPALGAADLDFSPGWVVAHWFIPVFNLFRPYQSMAEVWRESDPARIHAELQHTRIRTGTALVGWWWALFIIMKLADQAACHATFHPHTAGGYILADMVYILSDFFCLPAALLAILLVAAVDRRQEERFQLLQRYAAVLAENRESTAQGQDGLQ